MKKIKNFKAFFENHNIIMDLLMDSKDSGWYGNNLDDSFQCVRVDSGWLNLLNTQYGGDDLMIKLIDKINECNVSLWEDGLEDTFECVILEDILDENDDIIMVYNGWYEDLIAYFGR